MPNWLNIFYPRFEFLLRNKTANDDEIKKFETNRKMLYGELCIKKKIPWNAEMCLSNQTWDDVWKEWMSMILFAHPAKGCKNKLNVCLLSICKRILNKPYGWNNK